MPVYEYRCPECGAIREKIRKIDDRDFPVYCDCGLPTLMKLIMSKVRGVIKSDKKPWHHMPDHPPDDKMGKIEPINRS